MLAGCGWTQPGFDAGRSFANDAETTLTVGNAPSLTVHRLRAGGGHPIRVVAVDDDQIITQQDSGVVAYDARSCPRADGNVCTPIWTRPDRQYLAGDGSSTMLIGRPSGSVDVLGVDHHHKFDLHPVASDPTRGFTVSTAAVAGDHIVVSASQVDYHGPDDIETINVFDRAGCGAPACGPTHTFEAKVAEAGRWRVGGNTVVLMDLMSQSTAEPSDLRAFDLSTGALRWTAPGQFDFGSRIAVRGGLVIATRTSDTQALVFDLAGTQGCSGTPRVCAPFRTLATGEGTAPGLAVGGAVTAIARATAIPNTNTSRRSLALYPTTCSSSPCAPAATTTPVTGFTTSHDMPPTLTANLVLAVRMSAGLGAQPYHVVAYDASLTSGCSGTPKVCSPVADLSLGSLNGPSDEPIVWNGRVYVNVYESFVYRAYVLSLPGDIR
jgi:hypothetical protein